ncbi:hypothetical protein G7Y89_g11382 [Cudoniella acicularis]|uniref:Uncharacterized protein n=1 Tax=Cudoniella acicularis TaxID=354080 RepID=A0A8H4RD84_9HELO|nr:hypothetical protein G7Y89_g11382 [Cudoniella acicularis]
MKYTAILVAAAAVASAQFTIGPTGAITCTENPNGSYCVGDSLVGTFIVQCSNGVGTAGNCIDLTASKPPINQYYGPCYQSSPTAGDAVCSKDCIGYGAYGSFPLPASAGCVPLSSTSSSSGPTSTPTSYATSPASTTSAPVSVTTCSSTIAPTSTVTANTTSILSSVTSTGVTVLTSYGTTITQSFTTTICPSSTLSTIVVHYSIGTGTGALSTGTSSGNCTSTSSGSGRSSSGSGSGYRGSATATPVGPTITASVVSTGGALANTACAAMAGVGLIIAYFL